MHSSAPVPTGANVGAPAFTSSARFCFRCSALFYRTGSQLSEDDFSWMQKRCCDTYKHRPTMNIAGFSFESRGRKRLIRKAFHIRKGHSLMWSSDKEKS
jgi:hypothetical protein